MGLPVAITRGAITEGMAITTAVVTALLSLYLQENGSTIMDTGTTTGITVVKTSTTTEMPTAIETSMGTETSTITETSTAT